MNKSDSRALNKQILFDNEKDYLKFLHIMQLSRVTGFYYNKLQRLRIGKDGNTVSLTYKR